MQIYMHKCFLRRLLPNISTALFLCSLWACDDLKESISTSEASSKSPLPQLLHQKMASTALGVAKGNWTHIPVPPEDGPVLMPVVLAKVVYTQPSKISERLGYLRVGERVPRSEAPVSTEDCSGGWYAIRPLGFVCIDKKATLNPEHPVVRAMNVPPDRTKPMPYDYAFLRSIAPNYMRIPTKDEQFKTEMRLERHLRNYHKLSATWDAYELGANAVPLSASGAAQGKVAPETPIPSYYQRLGASNEAENAEDRMPPWWLEGRRRIPNLSTFTTDPHALIAERVKRHAGVALIGIFKAGPKSQDRNFSITVDGRLIPSDKLKADAGSSFHGVELIKGEFRLPLGFISKKDARRRDANGRHIGHALEYRAVVQLAGPRKKMKGVTFWELEDKSWVRERDMKVVVPRAKYPWFAKENIHWIDVSIRGQSMVLYEGKKAVYSTLVSTGRDLLGDPKTTLATPQGTFRIYQKHVTNTMDSRVADNEFELRDVPWVMYFKGGYALHAAYWHDQFGKARSHGCINLSPIDARYTFQFVSPDVPEHWHGTYAADAVAQGTIVEIRP